MVLVLGEGCSGLGERGAFAGRGGVLGGCADGELDPLEVLVVVAGVDAGGGRLGREDGGKVGEVGVVVGEGGRCCCCCGGGGGSGCGVGGVGG